MNGYRADQVGSYLRPPDLVKARARFQHGELSREGLRKIEDKAVLDVLDMQRQAGMPVFTDGEYRRGGWTGGLTEAVEGFVPAPGGTLPAPIAMRWRGEHLDLLRRAGQSPTPAVVEAAASPFALVIGAKLRAVRRIYAEDSQFLKQHSPGPFKITVTSPTWYLRQYLAGVSDAAYPTLEDALVDLQDITRAEIQALVNEDVPYVQVDSIRYVFDFTDEQRRQQWQSMGVDPDQAVDQTLAADNAVLDGVPHDKVCFGLHMCRGNNRSNYFAEGGYDRIAERVFPSLRYDRFLLEYDTERAGGFEPLRFVPRGKTVVLGLISTKDPHLESQDQLLRRIEEASKYVPIEDLALSPQCGFASVLQGNAIGWEDQRRKLDLLVETANKVWGTTASLRAL